MTSEASFLTDLFCRLDSLKVQYAVLRNAESLPMSLNGGDVDINVRHEDIIYMYVAMLVCAEANYGMMIVKIYLKKKDKSLIENKINLKGLKKN